MDQYKPIQDRGTANARLAAIGLVISVIVMGIIGLWRWVEPLTLQKSWEASIRDAGPLGLLAFVAVYIIAVIFMAPTWPLTMLGSVLIEPWWLAVALTSAAATSGATCSFLLSRQLARERVLRWLGEKPWFAELDRGIMRLGGRVVLLIRLCPIFPFAMINYVLGLTSVRLRTYILASWLGMLPGLGIGLSAGELLDPEGLLALNLETGVPIILLGLGSSFLISRMAYRVIRRAGRVRGTSRSPFGTLAKTCPSTNPDTLRSRHVT